MLLKYFSIAHYFCCDMDCTTAVSLIKWQLIWPEHSGFKSRLNFIFTLWFSIWLEADQETSINWFYGNNPKGCKPKHESDPDRLACGSKLLYQTKFLVDWSLKTTIVTYHSICAFPLCRSLKNIVLFLIHYTWQLTTLTVIFLAMRSIVKDCNYLELLVCLLLRKIWLAIFLNVFLSLHLSFVYWFWLVPISENTRRYVHLK